MARPPPSIIPIAMTQANTGRSRKNFDLAGLPYLDPAGAWARFAG